MTTPLSLSSAADKRRNLILFLGLGAYAVIGVNNALLGVVWPSMRATFGLPLDALGILLAVTMTGHLISSFNSGRLLAWMGIGPALALGSFATGRGVAAQSTAPAWIVLIGGGFVTGLGIGIINPALNTYIAENHSTRVMNWLHATFGIGATLGPLLVTAMLTNGLSWRWSYALIAVLQMVTALGYWVTRTYWSRSDPRPQQTAVSSKTAVSIRATLRRPLTWLGIFIFLLYTGTEASAGQWSYTLFTDGRGITATIAGLWISIYWACLTIGRMLIGFTAGRLGVDRLLRLSMALVVAGALLIWLNLGMISLGALALMGFGLAAIFPTLMAATPRRLGPAHAANAIGFQVAAAGLGASILPGLAGVFADAWGLETIGPFLVAAAVALFLTHELILLRERRVQ